MFDAIIDGLLYSFTKFQGKEQKMKKVLIKNGTIVTATVEFKGDLL